MANNKTAIKRFRDLRNLGPASEKILLQAGIDSIEVLAKLGALKAYFKIIEKLPEKANLNLLFALEGALTDCDWKQIAKKQKSRLLIELDSLEQFKQIQFGENHESFTNFEPDHSN